MKKWMLFLLLFINIHVLHAQYNTGQNAVWPIGYLGGVSFGTGAPIPFTSSLFTLEGYASVSDAAGNLLFYTEGMNVWNRTHAVMPSGADVVLFGTMSTTQGATIVPIPGAPGKYYVFSLGNYPGSGDPGHLAYSIVDMSLDGGMGDVVPSARGIPLFDSIGEKMVTIGGDNCNAWLIVSKFKVGTFYAFEITSSGISGPVVSHVGTFSNNAYGAGVLKVSHDRHHIVAQCQVSTGGTELYDFDVNTGILSNCVVLHVNSPLEAVYGAEFSPDNTKLYTQESKMSTGTSEIVQYDISLPTATAIIASKTMIHTYTNMARRDLKLAPNNKIYIPNPLHLLSTAPSYLDCINNPNVSGIGCIYDTNVVLISPGICQTGLPNTVWVPAQSTTIAAENMTRCVPEGGSTSLAASATAAGTKYTWYDGTTTATHPVSSSGTYWVYSYNGCDIVIDTFHVTIHSMPAVNLGNDTTISEGTTLILSAPAGSTCYWSTGSVTDTIHVTTSGTYYVTVRTELCNISDTINVMVTNGVTKLTQDMTRSVFPNPAKSDVTIKITGLSGNAVTVSCYNIVGERKATYSEPLNDGTLNMTLPMKHFLPGIYTLKITDALGRTITEQVVVEK